MVKVTHNRLTQMAERLLAQEHAGFKAGRSAVEQIFNIHILIENTFSTVKICTITLLTSKVFDSLARGAVAREAEIQHWTGHSPNHSVAVRPFWNLCSAQWKNGRALSYDSGSAKELGLCKARCPYLTFKHVWSFKSLYFTYLQFNLYIVSFEVIKSVQSNNCHHIWQLKQILNTTAKFISKYFEIDGNKHR